MRQRTRQVIIRLNDREYAYLKKQVDITGLKVAPYVRALIMGSKLRPRPPAEYTALLRELSAIGNNLNQIARIANTEKTISEQVIAQIAKTQMVIWKKVKDL